MILCFNYFGKKSNFVGCFWLVVIFLIVDFWNGGGGYGVEFCYIFLCYFSVEIFYMMFIVYFYILNGYIEFKMFENDYVRIVYEGII